MKAQDKLIALQKADLFSQVPEDAVKSFAELTSERRFRRGEILFTAGDIAIGLFVIVSGSLRAFRQTPEGREQTIHVETAGATLAEVPVFDGGSYPSTVEAEEDTVTLFLPKAAVRRFLLDNPEAALSALAVLAKRLRHVSARRYAHRGSNRPDWRSQERDFVLHAAPPSKYCCPPWFRPRSHHSSSAQARR